MKVEPCEIKGIEAVFGQLDVGPNDLLVFQVKDRLSTDQIERLRESIDPFLQSAGISGRRVLILSPDISIGKVSIEQ